MAGTNYFVQVSGSTTDWVALTEQEGQLSSSQQPAMFAKCSTTPGTQANTYGKGCLMLRTDNGTAYINTGTFASPTWTLLEAGAEPGAFYAAVGGKVQWSGGGSTLSATATGVLPSDLILATEAVNASSAIVLLSATAQTDHILFTLSNPDAGNASVITYVAFRSF